METTAGRSWDGGDDGAGVGVEKFAIGDGREGGGRDWGQGFVKVDGGETHWVYSDCIDHGL